MIHLDVFGRRARPEARVAPAAVDRLRSPIGRIAQGQFPSVRSKATSQPATRLQPHWDRICANVGDEPLPSFTEFFFLVWLDAGTAPGRFRPVGVGSPTV